jgi:hypothetical protein
MSKNNVFTLDAMREEIEKEFAPFQIEVDGEKLTLRNLLRVPKNRRDEVYGLLDELSAAQESEEGTLSVTEKSAQIALKIIPLVADKEKLARTLVERIEDDLALTLRLFNVWMDATQSGNSEDSSNS